MCWLKSFFFNVKNLIFNALNFFFNFCPGFSIGRSHCTKSLLSRCFNCSTLSLKPLLRFLSPKLLCCLCGSGNVTSRKCFRNCKLRFLSCRHFSVSFVGFFKRLKSFIICIIDLLFLVFNAFKRSLIIIKLKLFLCNYFLRIGNRFFKIGGVN